MVGRDSVAGIATSYGIDGPGIESRNRPDQSSDPPNLRHNGYRVSCPKEKRPGRGINHPLESSA
jgi:hypothetical protein